MLRTFLFFILFLSGVSRCSAAFPIKQNETPALVSSKEASLQQKIPDRRRPRIYHDVNTETTGFAIGSASCAAAGIGLMVLYGFILAGSIELTGWIVAALPVVAILAIVFGAIGMKRRLRGLAVAGMVLGIMEVAASWILMFFALLASGG
jgi:hypothetical protein